MRNGLIIIAFLTGFFVLNACEKVEYSTYYEIQPGYVTERGGDTLNDFNITFYAFYGTFTDWKEPDDYEKVKKGILESSILGVDDQQAVYTVSSSELSNKKLRIGPFDREDVILVFYIENNPLYDPEARPDGEDDELPYIYEIQNRFGYRTAKTAANLPTVYLKLILQNYTLTQEYKIASWVINQNGPVPQPEPQPEPEESL